jgi:biopolymer transport protein ExbD
MKIKSHRESFASLESIAITDIILNMFIFFFTAFSLVYTFNPSRESRIMVKLPQADIKTPVEQSDPVIINIKGRNEVFLGNKARTLKDLRTELQSLMARNKMRPVIVRADKRVVFDDVVRVLDVTKNAGVERLGIAIEEMSSPPPSRP